MPNNSNPLSAAHQAELRARYAGVKLDDCYVYHWFDLPDGTELVGSWDLRQHWRDYLGHFDFSGQRVLEPGPASGFLSLKMEALGADLVAFDLPPGTAPDLLPLPSIPVEQVRKQQASAIDRVRNSWWYVHRLFGSQNKAAYGSIYQLPDCLGRFDVSVFGAILLHLANPFAALQAAAAITDRAIIVTDLFAEHLADRAVMEFAPDAGGNNPMGWWLISPLAVTRMLTALGFPNIRVLHHQHRHHPSLKREEFTTGTFFTVVATRV